MADTARIQELTTLINNYRDAYYNNNTSFVSDEEYDALCDELEGLLDDSSLDITEHDMQAGSYAVNQVGYQVASELPKVKHNHPMLSLDKTKIKEKIISFIDNKPVVIMPKMDGLTCTLRYVNGKLESAETRGNGDVGELITHNALAISNIPNEIDTLLPEVIIDGELMITFTDFNRINGELLEQGYSEEELFKNPRNLASGTARQLDSSVCVDRNLKFVAWKVHKGPETDSFITRLKWAEKIGFDIVEVLWDNNVDIDTFSREVEIIKCWAKTNDYKIDGCVVGYDDIAYGESLGFTTHHPRNQIAYKFYDDTYPTTLRDVKWTIGKTGTITPTAIFDPVIIDGTTVRQASMHNLTIMKNLKASVDARCYVYKANMIIPQIKSFDNIECDIVIPSICPICGAPTEIIKEKDTEVLKCTNYNCAGTFLNKLKVFVGKDGFDIEDFGESTLKLFYEKGWIKSLGDIFTSIPNRLLDIAKLDGWTMKSATNLLSNIANSKGRITLDNYITALSIPNIGLGTAKTIAEYCDWNVDKFINYLETNFDWSRIEGIGKKTSDSINAWYAKNANIIYSFINEIKVRIPDISTSNSELSGKTFCITGTFSQSRDILKRKLEQLGGIFVSGVTKNTDILFAGEKAGSKLEKATKLQIPIYSEDDLMRLLNE